MEADLRMSFHKWFHTVRSKEESLIDYVSRFERNYNTFSNLGESLTPVCQALILLENANLDENLQSLISSRINFKSAKTDIEKMEILNECKEALRKYQYGRKTNVPCREIKMNKIQTLCNDLIKEGELEDEVFENLQAVFLAKNRNKSPIPRNSASNTGGITEGKPVYKCNICICGCPRETDCGCSCTKHFWYNCPQKEKKNGSNRGTRGGRGGRSFRGNRGRGAKKEDNDGEQSSGPTFLTYMRKVSEATLCVAPKEENSIEKAQENLRELKQYLYSGKRPKIQLVKNGEKEIVQRDQTFLSVNNSINEESKQVNMVIDTASPSTICGAKLFKNLIGV